MLDRRKGLRTDHCFHPLLASYRPDSNLPAAAGPVGSTFAVAAGRTVQAARTGPEVARSQGLAGRGWARRRSSRCSVGPAGMAACRPGGMGQHPGGLVAATEGIAVVRPGIEVSEPFSKRSIPR